MSINSIGSKDEYKRIPPEAMRPKQLMQLVPILRSERDVVEAKCAYATEGRGIEVKRELDFEEWKTLLTGFARVESAIQFIIGDLLIYGEEKFDREKYDAVVEASGKPIKTLYNWASVCRQIPPSARTFNVSYTHYYEVAYVADEVVCSKLLRQAEEQSWSAAHLRREMQKLQVPELQRDRFGRPIGIDGLAHAPINEQGVVFLFGLMSHKLGFSVEAIQQSFPDCIAKRKISERRAEEWGTVRIEFEFLSSEFRRHRHDWNRCDLIVCWKHDWPDCPIQVLELESEVEKIKSQRGKS